MQTVQRTLTVLLCLLGTTASGQQPNSSESAVTITFKDALARARQYGGQIETANIAAALAKEDLSQARAAALPTLNALNQFIYTEGNGTPSGVFVANDGVHVYNEQAVVHQELFSLVRRGEIRMAAAALAVAKAKADVAGRGLYVTVVQDYYAIIAAQRKMVNSQKSVDEAQRLLDITRKQENGGEAAHADVIKAQLQVQQRQRDIQDAQLATQKAKITLSVLIFPRLSVNYEIVDDLAQLGALAPLSEVNAEANNLNPDLRAAQANVAQSKLGVSVARYAYLPSFGLDFAYGIDANQFAARSSNAQATGRSTLPHFEVPYRQNLGYTASATLTVPVWNWGATHSKVKQAALKERQAEIDLSLAQRQVESEIATAYQEAQAALAQVESLHSSSDLAAESLRLTVLRYQAGEATVLEVVDAQTTANQARSAYDDGLLRYRVALAAVQSLTGTP